MIETVKNNTSDKGKLPDYQLPETVVEVLRGSRILGSGETPQDMLGRVVKTIFKIETKFNTPYEQINKLKLQLAQSMVDQSMSPGSPTLTNAGRLEHESSALTSCVLIPADLTKRTEAAEKIKAYWRQNMSSGFDLTPYKDPVGLLVWLNQLAAQETATGLYERYIGNMATLNVAHPKINEFIEAKRQKDLPHVNISVDVTDELMETAIAAQNDQLTNDSAVKASELLRKIAENAWHNGDPGIIYLERMNKDNPVAVISPYINIPPCAEMGLAWGETCQFGYINLAKFTTAEGIDDDRLKEIVYLLTRVLDNGVELNLGRYPDFESTKIARLKRKIGISVCGLADLLLIHDLPYDSEEARQLARDVLAFINYHSKRASVRLAEERGPCGAMEEDENQYLSGKFLEEKYASQATRTVSSKDWIDLADHIRQTGQLRNILTTALPPSGRTSILLGASASIEPIFGVTDQRGEVNPAVADFVCRHTDGSDFQKILDQAVVEGTFQNTPLSTQARACLKTAKEISSKDQVEMVAVLAGLNGVFDESASKTVNLPSEAVVDDVLQIFISAHCLGLKNISVYRDGSKANQPNRL